MTGQVYEKIQKLIAEGGKGDPTAIENIKTKLMLKGINPDKYSPNCADCEDTIENIKTKLMLKGINPDKYSPNCADCEDTPEILAIIEQFTVDLLRRRNEQ